MATLLYRLGRFSYRRRWLVLATWALVLALAGVGAATMSAPLSNTFSIPGTESQKALDLLDERLPGSGADGATARVVFVAPDGQAVTSPRAKVAVEESVVDSASASARGVGRRPFREPGGLAGRKHGLRDRRPTRFRPPRSPRPAAPAAVRRSAGRGRGSRPSTSAATPRRRRPARAPLRASALPDRRGGPGRHVRRAAGRGAAAAHRRRRCRSRNPRRRDRLGLHRAERDHRRARDHARPRGRHRLRPVHRLSAPPRAAARTRRGGRGRPCCRHRRVGCRVRGRHRRHRARCAVTRGHPVPHRDGAGSGRHGGRRRRHRADPAACPAGLPR